MHPTHHVISANEQGHMYVIGNGTNVTINSNQYDVGLCIGMV